MILPQLSASGSSRRVESRADLTTRGRWVRGEKREDDEEETIGKKIERGRDREGERGGKGRKERKIETPRCNGACQMAFHVYWNASFIVAQCREPGFLQFPRSDYRPRRAITPISDHVLVPIDDPILRRAALADTEFHRRANRPALHFLPRHPDGFCGEFVNANCPAEKRRSETAPS